MDGTSGGTAERLPTSACRPCSATENLYREAMANPELAWALISKMPASPEGGALHGLARLLRRGTIVAPMMARQAGGSKP